MSRPYLKLDNQRDANWTRGVLITRRARQLQCSIPNEGSPIHIQHKLSQGEGEKMAKDYNIHIRKSRHNTNTPPPCVVLWLTDSPVCLLVYWFLNAYRQVFREYFIAFLKQTNILLLLHNHTLLATSLATVFILPVLSSFNCFTHKCTSDCFAHLSIECTVKHQCFIAGTYSN